MARGENTEHHSNRKVGRENFMSRPSSEGACESCRREATTESTLTSAPMCQNCAEQELHKYRNDRS